MKTDPINILKGVLSHLRLEWFIADEIERVSIENAIDDVQKIMLVVRDNSIV